MDIDVGDKVLLKYEQYLILSTTQSRGGKVKSKIWDKDNNPNLAITVLKFDIFQDDFLRALCKNHPKYLITELP